MPQISEIKQPSSSLLIDNCQFKLTEPANSITLFSTYLHNTKVLTANTSLDNNQITSSFMTQLSATTPQTFVKTTYRL